MSSSGGWFCSWYCRGGNRPPDVVEDGHASSAPENPRLWQKVGITTVIAAVIFTIIYFVAEAGLINFRVEQNSGAVPDDPTSRKGYGYANGGEGFGRHIGCARD